MDPTFPTLLESQGLGPALRVDLSDFVIPHISSLINFLPAKETLKNEVGLTDAEFIPVPALFIEDSIQGGRYVHFIPSQVEGLMLPGDIYLTCDPIGPMIDGTDLFLQAVLDQLEPLGITSLFVDTWDSLHVFNGGYKAALGIERELPVSQTWAH